MVIVILLAELTEVKQAITYRALNRTIKATAILGGKIKDLRWEWKRMVRIFDCSFQKLSDEESKRRRIEAGEILNRIEDLYSLLDSELAKLNILYMDKKKEA